MSTQASDTDRRAVADLLVEDDGGTLDDLRGRIDVVWADLLTRRDAQA